MLKISSIMHTFSKHLYSNGFLSIVQIRRTGVLYTFENKYLNLNLSTTFKKYYLLQDCIVNIV